MWVQRLRSRCPVATSSAAIDAVAVSCHPDCSRWRSGTCCGSRPGDGRPIWWQAGVHCNCKCRCVHSAAAGTTAAAIAAGMQRLQCTARQLLKEGFSLSLLGAGLSLPLLLSPGSLLVVAWAKPGRCCTCSFCR